MREELHDARAIQLAMLPREAPPVAGLDIAGVWVPATEVGGNYYGYFPTDDGALAVAIGDVAGHGAASGLVLAGVRAGLYLLSDEIATDPARVLGRLNRIVAAPGGQRLLMTLGLCSFDLAHGRALWVSAGHPPPLHFVAATGTCEAPPTAHPPLGTKLPMRLETVERNFRAGDVCLLVSVGAIEARDVRGREFGEVAGGTMVVTGKVGSTATNVFGNVIAGTTLAAGTAVSAGGGAAYGVYQLSKAVVVPAGYELGSGIVLSYETLSQISAHAILAVSDCAYMVLSLEGPRWVLYAVKGNLGKGEDLPAGAVLDLKKMQEQGEEIVNLPVSDEEMKKVVESAYGNLPETHMVAEEEK